MQVYSDGDYNFVVQEVIVKVKMKLYMLRMKL